MDWARSRVVEEPPWAKGMENRLYACQHQALGLKLVSRGVHEQRAVFCTPVPKSIKAQRGMKALHRYPGRQLMVNNGQCIMRVHV